MRSLTLMVVVILGLAEAAAQDQRPLVEHVDVARVLVDARVVDDSGRPVRGLGAGDFIVRIDSRPVHVESVQWIDGSTLPPELLPSSGLEVVTDPLRRGRLIVFLIQKDLHPSRIIGLMRWHQINDTLLDTLTPDDRVAVLSFDSHLKIWTDFTDEIEQVRTIMSRGVFFDRPAPLEPRPAPSLLAELSQEEGRRTYTIERALARLGEALEPLPGAKSVVVIGFGFGRLSAAAGRVVMMPEYERARDALLRARATVFSLDVTEASYHSLEAGLQIVSGDTGGFFARLALFPQRAVERVTDALAGHYVLIVEKPESRPGTHSIDVRLAGRSGTVLARRTYTD